MTFKIDISLFMFKKSPNNGNETKLDIFHWTYSNLTLSFFIKKYSSISMTFKMDIFSWDIFRSDVIFHWSQYYNISITFIVGTFQFHCQSKHKKVKRNKITREMCKFDSIFPYLQSSTLYKRLLNFISWEDLSKKWTMIVTISFI